tara:strand:- start:1167 stop:1400 length:234 start_codon:yes stop_codon:yes gene_type:complete
MYNKNKLNKVQKSESYYITRRIGGKKVKQSKVSSPVVEEEKDESSVKDKIRVRKMISTTKDSFNTSFNSTLKIDDAW